MYTRNELHDKLTQLRAMTSENEVVEFKEAKTTYHFDKIGKYVSALSNEANLLNVSEAWLVFGVKDKVHTLVGSRFRMNHSDLMSLKKEIADATNERFTFNEIYVLEVDNNRIIMFSIPPAPKGIPIYFKGHYYARDHESLVSLSIDKIEKIRKQATKYDWSSYVINEATIEDLDSSAIAFAREQFVEKFPFKANDLSKWDDTKFLDKAKLTRKGKITRTAIILLGKEESEHFINPSECKIRWKLLDERGDSKTYEIINVPMLLGINKLFNRIRIIKYRYIADNSLFPEEVDNYDSFSIREAINNCIAHQDYELGGRINVIERPDSLTFTNKGSFIPESVEKVIVQDIPEETYRNTHLVNAMFNLNMVDTEGGGIRKMFNIQVKRFFPLPEYDISSERVAVTIIGKVLDLKYANILARNSDLILEEIILLDKVQKGKDYLLTDKELKYLRKNKLVEGRKGNLYLSKDVAQKTGQKVQYSRVSGFNKEQCKELILKSISDHSSLSREELDALVFPILSSKLDLEQKKNKTMNIIQELRKEGMIINIGTRSESKWILS